LTEATALPEHKSSLAVCGFLPLVLLLLANPLNGNGGLSRIFATAQKDDLDFNLAYIPGKFNAPHPEEFDTK